MNSLIFRTTGPIIVGAMLVFAIYICLRGHNEPGGGFIGGLIAASAIAVLGISSGPDVARRALRFDPVAIAAFGLLLAASSGLMSLFTGNSFLTSIWIDLDLGGANLPLSTPLLFDIGVFLVVLGAISAIGLGLEQEDGEGL
ncbi:MAG TPA: MnhB domain-containing protein [Devosia sp.]